MAGSVTWAIPGRATSIGPHIEEGNPGERTASQHSLGKEGRGELTQVDAEGLESASTRGGSKAQPLNEQREIPLDIEMEYKK